ncbi:MAG: GYD domain-containing protein [Halobacteriota archaeon]
MVGVRLKKILCCVFLAIGLLRPIYFTFGRYDRDVIAEASSDEAMAKALLMLGGFGTVNVETLKRSQKQKDLK